MPNTSSQQSPGTPALLRQPHVDDPLDRRAQRYQPAAPRTASSVAAVALAALTLGVLIVLPAKYQPVVAASSTIEARACMANPAPEHASGLPDAREQDDNCRQQASAASISPGSQRLPARDNNASSRNHRASSPNRSDS